MRSSWDVFVPHDGWRFRIFALHLLTTEQENDKLW
nr:MAG TPA: hypothetical protein [Caudoviricetes sp.]